MSVFNYLLCASICLLELAKGNGLPPLQDDEDTLELLHVVFRHGDRTPYSLYPNDPYTADTFYPVGIGELTNPGKLKEYNIGSALRQKYARFIGDTYTPSLIEVNASPHSRTRASVLLVLAALFPPKGEQVWNKKLLWQPIPYQYIPKDQNRLFIINSICSNYNNLINQSEIAYEASGRLRAYQGTIKYLLENSGYTNISNTDLFLMLYSTFKSEQEWGLTLPPWADSVWPEPLTTLANVGWEIMVGTEELRPLVGGFLMGKIINDTYAKVNNLDSVKGRKIYLYSGHDSNIAGVLSWLGVFVPHSPAYGSYVTFEIHKIRSLHFIKIFHQNYDVGLPVQVSLPNCDPVCPLDDFVKLYAQYFDTRKHCDLKH